MTPEPDDLARRIAERLFRHFQPKNYTHEGWVASTEREIRTELAPLLARVAELEEQVDVLVRENVDLRLLDDRSTLKAKLAERDRLLRQINTAHEAADRCQCEMYLDCQHARLQREAREALRAALEGGPR